MRVETAAAKWHAARVRRLAAQKAVRAARSGAWRPVAELLALEAARAEARRIESRALRQLAKACAQARVALDEAEEGVMKPRLPSHDVIDI